MSQSTQWILLHSCFYLKQPIGDEVFSFLRQNFAYPRLFSFLSAKAANSDAGFCSQDVFPFLPDCSLFQMISCCSHSSLCSYQWYLQDASGSEVLSCTSKRQCCSWLIVPVPGLAVLRLSGSFFCLGFSSHLLSVFFPLQPGHLYGCSRHFTS